MRESNVSIVITHIFFILFSLRVTGTSPFHCNSNVGSCMFSASNVSIVLQVEYSIVSSVSSPHTVVNNVSIVSVVSIARIKCDVSNYEFCVLV